MRIIKYFSSPRSIDAAATMAIFSLVALAGCSGTVTDRTAVIVEIQSEYQAVTEIDQVKIALSPSGKRLDYAVGPISSSSKKSFPIKFGLLPEEASDEKFSVDVEGLLGGVTIVKTGADAKFEKGATGHLVLVLRKACSQKLDCEGDTVCGTDGTCSVLRARGPLPKHIEPDGSVETLADGGTCTPRSCAERGINCGTSSECGVPLDCGTCIGENEQCGGGGRPNVCGCTKTSCAALRKTCGNFPDGCGGTVSCGECSNDQFCGDGNVNGKEECDDKNSDDTDSCRNTCEFASCGDGITAKDKEECDDGNALNTDACTSSCRKSRCGDGYLQMGEGCDDGDSSKVDLDACAPDCSWRYEKKHVYSTVDFFGNMNGGYYVGDFGGPTGADSICQQLIGPNRLNSIWKAMIVGGARRAAATPFNTDQSQDWVIRKYTYYYNGKDELVWRTDSTRLLGVRNGVPQNLLANFFRGYPWSGWRSDWTTQPHESSNGTCNGWTSSKDEDWGTFALQSLEKGAGEPCSSTQQILCVEQ